MGVNRTALVAVIQQEFAEPVERNGPMANRDGLAAQANQAAVEAIDVCGISVEDDNKVVSAAEADAERCEQLIEAAYNVLWRRIPLRNRPPRVSSRWPPRPSGTP